MTALLELDEVELAFGGLVAIGGLSLRVDKGEVLAVIGPNGAGKTSMLNLVTRVFNARRGRIRFKGQDIAQLPRARIAHLGIARTFQNIELFDAATVLDNLLLGRHRFGSGGWWQQVLRTPALTRLEESHRAKAEEVIEFLDLSPWRNARVAGLPYGVRKVVELGRALCAEPELLFLDEPASGLNPEETRDLAFWIEDIRTELGITVVMIEHDMSLVSAVADRVICMAQGKMLAEGTPAEVQGHPDVIAAYLGT
ncbi:ABC transporter ATP-binding protein [Pararhodobacter aggregans]|uniref:ABC transporter ATP-binding protein n=1 Tax=Pararhodobacter aggregans TaxID=404875 RepID=A0A2T7UUF0_9RHOB|nr:ABC transporter ATP-binding protein [Pararhodobacter aggregans]PTX04153.1 amino acid/amide ABC transporter ATP-binding protein 1 (HAAT family) [Pararhodobacter aggregans]PVE48390.1 ABC transporter ATP-binding protein [Pararhodobacter aggregans]